MEGWISKLFYMCTLVYNPGLVSYYVSMSYITLWHTSCLVDVMQVSALLNLNMLSNAGLHLYK